MVFSFAFSEVKARTACPKCPTPQTRLPRHLLGTHKVDPSELENLLPPTYRRRTKSVQADEEEEDLDDPLAIAAEAETSVEDDEENSGDDQGVGDDPGMFGAGHDPNDPNDILNDPAYQVAPGAGQPQQQQQPQVVVRAEDVEAALRAMHGDDPVGPNLGVQQAAAVATDRTAKPVKKSGTR